MQDITRMHDYHKEDKPDHWTNCNDEYCEIHYSSHVNRNRYLNPYFTTFVVCGTWSHGRIIYDIEGLILEKEIKELTKECAHTKAQARSLLRSYLATI